MVVHRLQSERKESLSSYLVRGCRMPKWEYEERQARLRFPLLVSPILNFLHSHDDCSSIARCCWRISPRLIVLTVYGLVPFISSFHDLRLLCGNELHAAFLRRLLLRHQPLGELLVCRKGGRYAPFDFVDIFDVIAFSCFHCTPPSTVRACRSKGK